MGNYTYLFNANGQLIHIIDETGNLQTLNYDTNNRLTSVVADNNAQTTSKQISFTYNNNSLINQINEQNGAAVINLSYQNGLLTNIVAVDANGNTLTQVAYTYNSDNTFASITRDNNSHTTVTFNYSSILANDGLTRIPLANTTDALSSTQLSWVTPDTGAAETVADTNIYNGTTYYDFDASGNLIATTYPQPNGATNYIIDSATFDANFNPLTETESTINPDDGSTTGTFTDTFTYTNEGLPQTYTNLAGKVWSATYSGVNLLTTQDPVQATQGIQEVYSYDDASQPNLPTSYTDADAGTWNFAYNSFGQILTLTPPNPQNAATMTYNGAGYPATATDGNGNLVTFDNYDALGDLLQVSTYPITGNTSVHNTTTFAYDARQRPTTVTNPDGTTSQNVYVGDHLSYSTDEAGTQYNFFWCPVCGALTGLTGPLSWGLHWHYDGDHQLSTFTDANQHVTQYTYGLAEELKQIAYPDGSGFSYSYNNRGQVYQVTNGRGDAVQYTYDNLERLTEIDFPTSGQASIFYTYNDDDTVHTVTDGIGTTTFTYTPAGRVHSVVYNYAASGLSQQQELDYVYNLDGSRQSLTWQTGLGQNYVWNYGYDGGGRLTSVTDPFQQTTVYAYDGEDKITSQSNANATSVSYTYNQARGWPTGIAYSSPPVNGVSSPFATYNLTYDNGASPSTVGNLTGVTEIDGSTETYGYDALYRLTGEARADSNNNALYGATYTYDLAGNSTQINVSTQIEGLSSFTYNAANTITSLTDNAGTNDQFTLGVTSDGDGNMTGLNGLPALFTWDDRNKLIATQSADGGTLQYGYDAMGHRVVSLLDNTTLTFYIFDGDLLLGELQVPNQQMSSLPGQPNRKSASAAKKPQIAASSSRTRLASSHGPGAVKPAVSTMPPVVTPSAPSVPSSAQTPPAAGSCPPSDPTPPAPAPTTAAGGCPPSAQTPATPTTPAATASASPTASATAPAIPTVAASAVSTATTSPTSQPATVALASSPDGGAQTNPRIPPYFLKNPPGSGATPDTKQLKKKRKPKQPPSGAHPDDETTGSSQPTVTAVYTWGASGLISEWTSSLNNSLWYAFGPQGETRQLTDSTGAVADTYVYSAYGTPVQQTGSDVNPFEYGGQVGYYSDANNPYALELCGERWYFYGLQRWLSRDPIGYEGDENLYRYCRNNPLRALDPTGEIPPLDSVRSSILAAVRARDWATLSDILKSLPALSASAMASTLEPLHRYLGTLFVPIFQKFGLLKCVEAADAIQSELEEKGISYEVIEINCGRALRIQPLSWWDKLRFWDRPIYSKTGYHVAIRVFGRVYDTITGPNGLEYQDWLTRTGVKASDVIEKFSREPETPSP